MGILRRSAGPLPPRRNMVTRKLTGLSHVEEHCCSLRARVLGSPGSSFGNSGTNDCKVFKTMFNSAILGSATDAGGGDVPVRAGCLSPASLSR